MKRHHKMKRNRYIISLLFIMAVVMFSCEDYLNIPLEAEISEEEVFGSYASFQGFQDQLMRMTVDYNRNGARATNAIGGEGVSPSGQTIYNGNRGDYRYVVSNRGIYPNGTDYFQPGLYESFWGNIRMANMCLEQLESGLLVEATDDERNWLKGQAYFFRGFFYWEMVRAFGTLPYVEMVLDPADQPMQRHWTYEKDGKTYNDTQAVFEKIAEDFQSAADLLPAVWPAQNINYMRPNKVASLGFKAKALQYSASPLFVEQSTGVKNTYDKELLDRCVVACQQTIDLAKSIIGQQPAGMPAANADGLTDWADMRLAFASTGGIQPGTPEVLFHRPVNRYGHGIIKSSQARNWQIKQISGSQKAGNASQNYMDKFEMADGSRYDLAYDHDPVRRWDDRDPRFDFNFYTHGDKVGSKLTLDLSEAKMKKDNMINSNAMRKYMADGVYYKDYQECTYSTPFLRLADIYLAYAEAAFESSGSYTTIPAGGKMTAEEAVNIIRRRCGHTDVAVALPFYANNPMPNSCELADDPAFRLLYRNEQNVELAYEGQYWFDIRRWKRAHLKHGMPIQALVFDGSKEIDENSVRRKTVVNYVFTDAHYWLPFENEITQFTMDWEQNPGW
ncbi:MAG: RagB/SusD family nutrient uptake outer membrane protein [Draconibacterium sp.]|nr:RagB/SusD family nutrient uptake outer membrane protein [Draconibacterium sp.]